LHDAAVISIAHRLTTTRGFDRILVMDQGRIVDSGSYEELTARNPMFRSVSGSAEA
jgi:ABC-type multidrug transport system fused ATPase/permease subunit